LPIVRTFAMDPAASASSTVPDRRSAPKGEAMSPASKTCATNRQTTSSSLVWTRASSAPPRPAGDVPPACPAKKEFRLWLPYEDRSPSTACRSLLLFYYSVRAALRRPYQNSGLGKAKPESKSWPRQRPSEYSRAFQGPEQGVANRVRRGQRRLKSSVADRDAYPWPSISPALKGRAKFTWPLPRPPNRSKAQKLCGIRRVAASLLASDAATLRVYVIIIYEHRY